MENATETPTQNTTMELYTSPAGRSLPVVRDNGPHQNLLDTARFNQLWCIADVYAKSKIVPDHFKGDPASVFVVLEMALRVGAHPFQALQNCYVIHGRPAWEGKFIIALINTSGLLDGVLDWKHNGKQGDDGGWICFATLKGGKKIQKELTWKEVKAEGWLGKQGSKWASMPEMMFAYRSAAQLARKYFPQVLLGMYSRDEVEDDMAPGAPRVLVEVTPPTQGPVGAELPEAAPAVLAEPQAATRRGRSQTLFEQISKDGGGVR